MLFADQINHTAEVRSIQHTEYTIEAIFFLIFHSKKQKQIPSGSKGDVNWYIRV